MDFSNLSIWVTIPGFVYLIGFSLLVLQFSRIANLPLEKRLLNLLRQEKNQEPSRSYFLYAGIGVVFFSYIVGFTAHVLTECVISHFHDQFAMENVIGKLNSLAKQPDQIYDSLQGAYSNLVLFRHLWFAFGLLGFSSLLYFWPRKRKTTKWFFLWLSWLVAVIFEFAYFVERGFYIAIMNSVR